MAELRSSYGMLGTYDASGLAETKHGPWGVMGAGGALGTDGFIQEAPWQRGPVDINSNVHAQNGLVLGEHDRGPLRLFVRGSGFNEDRSNGTPYQVNGTRLWRYAAGGDWQGPHDGSLAARLYGSDEHYHQTFSSISNLPNFGDPDLLLSLRRNPHPLQPDSGQRTRRRRPLEPASRRRVAVAGRRGCA